jgi:hypothetical protein
MKQVPLASKSDLFAGLVWRSGNIWTDSYRGLHKSPSNHPQVREHEQGEELNRVLGQAAVTLLGVSKLAFNIRKRVFHLGADIPNHGRGSGNLPCRDASV